MPAASSAACCIAAESEWATGGPMRAGRLVLHGPLRGRAGSAGGARAPPRPLVDPRGDARRSHLDRPQLAGADLEVAHGLAAGDARDRPLGDVRAPGAPPGEPPAPRRGGAR